VLNARVDRELAEALKEQFIEVLFAPGYDEDALEILQARKNVRLLEKGDRRAGGRRARGAPGRGRPARAGPRHA
jgi:AICAR transformylase/IMP cyclohydrolase PurH